MFIVFEGIDGSGKSTQIKLLKEFLENKDLKVLTTFEPGASDLFNTNKELRKILLHTKQQINKYTESLLFAADRVSHIETVILPAISENKIVISDRFVDSSIAYQSGGSKLSRNFVKSINEFAYKTIMPDLTILLDISAKKMRLGKKKDNFESNSKEFFTRVRNTYLELSKQNNYLVIDSENNSIEQIHKIICKKVNDIFLEIKD
jgi:dTMP kinase